MYDIRTVSHSWDTLSVYLGFNGSFKIIRNITSEGGCMTPDQYNYAIESALSSLVLDGISLDTLILVIGSPSKKIKDKALGYIPWYCNNFLLRESWILNKEDLMDILPAKE